MSYAKGANFERTVQHDREAKGSVVGRGAGSKGRSGADLYELRPGGKRPRLIQCKATKTPWSGFGPSERSALLGAATSVGADAVLAWRLPGDNIRWYPPETWPS